jgi:hypothetical protein
MPTEGDRRPDDVAEEAAIVRANSPDQNVAMHHPPAILAAPALALTAGPAPGADVKPWIPAGISSPQFESHAAFDPLTGDFYFVRSSPKFEGWRILVSRCGQKGWSPPHEPVFAGDGVEADPYFEPDGRSLYFQDFGAGATRYQTRSHASRRWAKPVILPSAPRRNTYR